MNGRRVFFIACVVGASAKESPQLIPTGPWAQESFFKMVSIAIIKGGICYATDAAESTGRLSIAMIAADPDSITKLEGAFGS